MVRFETESILFNQNQNNNLKVNDCTLTCTVQSTAGKDINIDHTVSAIAATFHLPVT